MECPLCHNKENTPIDDVYSECNNCGGIFMNKIHYLDSPSERKRYEEHNNDPLDPRYQQFVSPITNYVLNNVSNEKFGLDFGSGSGPVISKMLYDSGYNIAQYDPFFSPDISVLNKKYDFIACCEVIEHFKEPGKDFKLLFNLLKTNGKLLCMTKLYHDKISFKNWYYRRDPTHVFIYQDKTISYISNQFGFKKHCIKDRLIILEK